MRGRLTVTVLLLAAALAALPGASLFAAQVQDGGQGKGGAGGGSGGSGGSGGTGGTEPGKGKRESKPFPMPPDLKPATPLNGDGGGSPRRDGSGSGAAREDRLVPDATGNPWRMWLARNLHVYEPPPIAAPDAHTGTPPYVLDPVLRAQTRELFRSDVSDRLTELFRDPDDRIRGAAALSFARAGFVAGSTDATRILALLDDSQRRVHDQGLLAAGLADGSAARYRLLRLASSDGATQAGSTDSERTRTRALSALFLSLHGEPSLALLATDLASDRRVPMQYRSLVIEALGLAGNPTIVPTLVELVRDRGESSLIRAAAVSALGQLGESATAPIVLELLDERDHDTEVRAAAALAIGELVRAADVASMRTLINACTRESNAQVSRFMLLSLGKIGGHLAELKILRTLQQAGADDRVFADLALGLLARANGIPQTLTPLLDALRGARMLDEKCAVLCALGLTGQTQALEPIADETLRASAPEVRRAGIVALYLLGRPGCLPVLQKLLLEDDAPEVRIQAAEALARLDPGATLTLIQALGSSRSRGVAERAAIIRSLGYTRDPSVLQSLLDLLREKGRPSLEREAAVSALGLIYDARIAPPTARVGEKKSFLNESAEIEAILTLAD